MIFIFFLPLKSIYLVVFVSVHVCAILSVNIMPQKVLNELSENSIGV